MKFSAFQEKGRLCDLIPIFLLVLFSALSSLTNYFGQFRVLLINEAELRLNDECEQDAQ